MDNQDPLLLKAERYIRSAQLLTEDGDFDSAASRLYYAMFYITEKLLEVRGLSFSSHRAVISAFGQHFIRTNEMDASFHHALMAAFSQRQLGDYAAVTGLHKVDVDALLNDANHFLEAARAWLAKNS